MKNIWLCILSIFAMSCSGNAQNNVDMKGKKILVAYYSWGGNTREVANYIKELTGADIFEIIPKQAYPTDYDEAVEYAGKEIKQNYEPELEVQINNLQDYDIIFVGSPCWWSTIAPPVRTFLHQNDFSGKTIVPFMTHGTSGLTVQDMKILCPNSTVFNGLGIFYKSMETYKSKVEKWLKELNATH
ncbi:MAG: flavodoxin [Prevotellaceae bacterium]|jgi:flavodoxin|nr:flavodoxin [Prevotellaceae bacterium]